MSKSLKEMDRETLMSHARGARTHVAMTIFVLNRAELEKRLPTPIEMRRAIHALQQAHDQLRRCK